MKTSFFCVLVCFLCTTVSYTQTIEPSSTVEKSILQFELEASYLTEKNSNEELNYWSVPSALIRVGLFESLEIDLSIPVVIEQIYEKNKLNHSLHKFEDLQIGFTLNLWKQNQLLPEAALMSRVLIPIHKESSIEELIALNFSNQLTDKLFLNYNIGCVFGNETTSNAYYIVNLSFNASSKVHLFVEDIGGIGPDQS